MHSACKTVGAIGAVKRRIQTPSASLPHQTDVALLAAVAARSGNAMETLYRRHSVPVYRYIGRLVGDSHFAEDIASDVFLEVWHRAGNFQGRSQVRTWILGIARLKALSALRRQRWMKVSDAGHECAQHVAEDAIPDLADTPEEELLKKQSRAQMQDYLTRLSKKHREIIDLLYYQDKTIDEIAAITSASRNTIKTRAFYARQQLARLMRPADWQRDPASIGLA